MIREVGDHYLARKASQGRLSPRTLRGGVGGYCLIWDVLGERWTYMAILNIFADGSGHSDYRPPSYALLQFYWTSYG